MALSMSIATGTLGERKKTSEMVQHSVVMATATAIVSRSRRSIGMPFLNLRRFGPQVAQARWTTM